jgi:hypothetical protein
MKKLSVTIKINASAQIVFDSVTDWENQDNWVFLTKVRDVGKDSRRLGGRIEAFTGIRKIGFLDTMTITKWDYPHLCEVTHTGKIVQGKGIFEVTSTHSDTYFTWTEYTKVPFGFVGTIGWIAIGPLTKLGMRWSLRRLRNYIEINS